MTGNTDTKGIAAAFFAALNNRDWEQVRRLCSPTYVHHAPRVPAADVATYIETAARMLVAFPDIVITVEQFVAEGEYVATRYSARGTHRGTFAGVAATGRPVVMRVLAMQRIVGGAIAEGWFEFDTGEIEAQLQAGNA